MKIKQKIKNENWWYTYTDLIQNDIDILHKKKFKLKLN